MLKTSSSSSINPINHETHSEKSEQQPDKKSQATPSLNDRDVESSSKHPNKPASKESLANLLEQVPDSPGKQTEIKKRRCTIL